jgi:hypothetical protein
MATVVGAERDPIGAHPRIERCRLLDGRLNRCANPAADPVGEIALCARHLARALELLRRRLPEHVANEVAAAYLLGEAEIEESE